MNNEQLIAYHKGRADDLAEQVIRLKTAILTLRNACKSVQDFWLNDPRQPNGGLCDTISSALKDSDFGR